MNYLITADKVGDVSGGGSVTFHESMALGDLGERLDIIDRSKILNSVSELPVPPKEPDPWMWDEVASQLVSKATIAHFYSGTFSRTIKKLKKLGAKISYTIAAHSIDESRREHESLHGSFPYTHLTDPELFKKYSEGYKLADRIIVPSPHSADVLREQGICDNSVVISHGCYPVAMERLSPQPKMFTVGYLGAYGPDKGVKYLFQAWKKLGYKDALLLLGGERSTSQYVSDMVAMFGGGNIQQAGWYTDISDFYNKISLYVQPSVTEGYGIEVLEAMMHSKQVLCSTGAGANFLLESEDTFNPRDVDGLAEKIDYWKKNHDFLHVMGKNNRKKALNFTWDKIEKQYTDMWKEMT